MYYLFTYIWLVQGLNVGVLHHTLSVWEKTPCPHAGKGFTGGQHVEK